MTTIAVSCFRTKEGTLINADKTLMTKENSILLIPNLRLGTPESKLHFALKLSWKS